MNTKIYINFLIFFLLLTAIALFSQPSGKIPLRDFFRNAEKAVYKISPDGQYIAHKEPYQNRLNLFVQHKDSSVVRRVTSVTERDIIYYFWKGNNRLIYFRDFGGDENYHAYGINIDGSGAKDLTPYEGVKVNIEDFLPDDETNIIISMNKRSKEVFDVYRLNTITGELKLLAENPGNIDYWLTDHEGKLRIAIAIDDLNKKLLYRKTENDPFREVLTIDFYDDLRPDFFSFDNNYLYARSNINRDKMALVTIDPETGKEINKVFEVPDTDVEWVHYSRKRKVITEYNYRTWKDQRVSPDKETKELYKYIKRRLNGLDVYITSNDKNEENFIITANGDRTPGVIYLYGKNTHKLTKLADLYPWLKETDLCEMKPIYYHSRDGLTIHGYLTLPKGKYTKNLPLIVIPHGGPWLRDNWGYRSEVQFLASRGYAVLQMNFRGSRGYGKAFYKAGVKQWGKKMQDDITDGVQYIIKEGVADPKRIGIYGGSYGGYATLAGLAFTPDLYACGVDYVGISNLLTFMKAMPPYLKFAVNYMEKMVGDPVKDSVLLAEVSPALHADNIKVPLLIAQGAKDVRVNINESNQMVEALRKRGIEVPYIVKENEGHGFGNEENRLEFYEAMESFFATYLSK